MISILKKSYYRLKEIQMKLSAPKTVTWWIAVILGVLGILGNFVTLPFVSANAFWFVAIGFVLLALATFLKDL
jgi:membrane protein YdbS with pleckstrin-like domain